MATNQHTVLHKITSEESGLDQHSSDVSVCQYAVANCQHLKRGDIVELTIELDDRLYIFDGQEMHLIPPNDKLPNQFKVVTEFPIQYWHSNIEVFDSYYSEVNFDYDLFKDQIVSNLAYVDNYVQSKFTHNDQEYTLYFELFDEWDDTAKQNLIDKLATGEGYYFASFSSEIDGDEHTLFCVLVDDDDDATQD